MLWLLVTTLFVRSAFGAEVYFSPSADCENRIVQALDSAKSEIKVAVYSLNNRKLTDALLRAKKRGVKLRVLTDSTQASQRTSSVFPLLAQGVDLRVHSKYKIEHNKFAVYDGAWVSTGSFNWTGPAARSNSENCVFLNEIEMVSKFSERFEFLWQKNTADGSKARLAKLESKRKRALSHRPPHQ